MAATDTADGSEDVADFLRRIKELNEKRDREDEERTKKLEDEIRAGRRQREARRAERARSLSPEKESPLGTPRSPRSSRTAASPLSGLSTPQFSASIGGMLDGVDDCPQPSKAGFVTPTRSEPHLSREESVVERLGTPSLAGTPNLSGKPSWQQRAESVRGFGSRPLSVPERAPSLRTSLGTARDQGSISRDQIAKNLSSRDPSWFKQTGDSGVSTAAYRHNQDENEGGIGSTNKRTMPGMAKEIGSTTDRLASRPDLRSPIGSSQGALTEEEPTCRTVSRAADSGILGRNSPLPPQMSQQFRPSTPVNADHSPSGSTAASPVHTDPPERVQRSPSPIKGLGGFVQSAMMKRSDSMNKRWSVQTTAGLNRQGSSASLRSGFAGTRDDADSPISTSVRATATRELATMSKAENGNASPILTPSKSTYRSRDAPPEPLPPKHESSQSVASVVETKENGDSETSPPPSPSKRWSPVKSSWLESALSRPSSPQLTAPSSPQPNWILELNKNKQHRSSVDMTPKGDSNRSEPSFRTQKAASSANPEGRVTSTTLTMTPQAKPKPLNLAKSSPHSTTGYIGGSESASFGSKTKPALPTKIKPDPPVKDFRSALKPLDTPAGADQNEELEFRNVFGKLRRANTEKRVVPDELKDNILRGKAALAVTDGPQQSARKDELKTTLIQQRESMKMKAAAAPDTPEKPLASRPQVTPESIAKKRALESNASSGNAVLRSSKDISGAKDVRSEPASPAIEPISKPVPQPEPAPSSKLANRFNPALARVFAKGPSPAPNSAGSSRTASQQRGGNTVSSESAMQSATEPLQHMTKARARGPKRRAPKADRDTAVSKSQVSPAKAAAISTPVRAASSSRRVTPSFATLSKSPVIEQRAKPQTPPKSPTLGQKPDSPQANAPHSPQSPLLHSRPIKPSGLRASLGSTEVSTSDTETPAAKAPAENPDTANMVSVKAAAGLWGRRNAPNSTTTSSKPIIQFLSANHELSADADLALLPKSTISFATPKSTTIVPAELPSKTAKLIPPKVVSKPVGAKAVSASTRAEPAESDAFAQFKKIFGDAIPTNVKLDVDTQAILSVGQASSSKIKTLRKHVSEMSSDGKTSPLPTYQDHVLFDDRVYLCTHVFGDATGARVTEVYLWAGNPVSVSTFEESQVFARKTAKEYGGKLYVFRQGKETSNFFQALGGILITRRGSARKSAGYMLCGRQHLGHIAFDEVELSPVSLCSGFPFIVASSVTVFLWKGTGCNPDELAGARLMSMDLGLSGRVIEIDEGQEKPEFFAAFPNQSGLGVQPSAEHWRLKAKKHNYTVRLFRVERSPGSQDVSAAMASLWNRVRRPSHPDTSLPGRTEVTEVVPFCQADLEPENVYVLDAFFELYVILGPLAHSKFPAFASAILFAQDYAIIAASNEDRPYVPKGVVVLQQPPKDMKAVFRQWDEKLMETNTEMLMMGARKHEGNGSAGLVGLVEAIKAVVGMES